MQLEAKTLNPMIAHFLRENLSVQFKPMPEEVFLPSKRADGTDFMISPGVIVELKLGDEVISTSEHRV